MLVTNISVHVKIMMDIRSQIYFRSFCFQALFTWAELWIYASISFPNMISIGLLNFLAWVSFRPTVKNNYICMAQTAHFTITQHLNRTYGTDFRSEFNSSEQSGYFFSRSKDIQWFSFSVFFLVDFSVYLCYFLFKLLCWHFNLTFTVGVKKMVEKCAKTWKWESSNHTLKSRANKTGQRQRMGTNLAKY